MNLLAEQPNNLETTPPQISLFDLALDPFLKPELNEARTRAETILGQNRSNLMAGHFEQVPLPIDVLSTAELVIEADNPYLAETYSRALEKDSIRLVAETMRKRSWEYFSPIFQAYDEQKQDFKVGRIALNSVVENGLSPLADPEEQQIRINEYLEHQTSLLIRQSLEGTDQVVSLITIKECPDYVIKDFQKDKKASHGGYVPEIKKLVLERAVISEHGKTLEQFAIPGEYIDHESIIKTLKEQGSIQTSDNPSKLDLRGKPFIGSGQDNELEKFIELLDQNASQKHSKRIFMGEQVDDVREHDYREVKSIAIQRQANYQEKAVKISEHLKDSARNKVDKQLAEYLLSDFIKKLLFEEVINDPARAAIIFDQRTADSIVRAQVLISQGQLIDWDGAKNLILKNAPNPSFCGAGSCGLEAVNDNSTESRIVKSLGLKGEIIKDTIRNCPFCGHKAIHYDVKGSKACTHCKKSEIK